MAFITIAGEQQIANKQGTGATLNIVKFVLANIENLGDEPTDRVDSIPSVSDIVAQNDVMKSGYVSSNQVVYSLIMGSDVGDFDFNWIGLVDDENVLVAVTYVPTISKRKTDGGVQGNTLTRNFLLAYTGIQPVTGISVPIETWQIDFNARLNGIDERERLSNLDVYGHESFLMDGWEVTKSGTTNNYSVTAGIGYVGGIRAKNTLDQVVTVTSKPNSIWLDVSLQGDISDRSTVVEIVVSPSDQMDYSDSNDIYHYLTKIANIETDGSVIDERYIYDNVAQHEEKVDPHPQYHDAAKLNKGTVSLDRLPTGAGKGLDADKLDGQDGSYYRNASYLNAGTVSLDRLPTGSGKGFDSDKLDGQHGAYYRDASHLNAGTVPLARLPMGTGKGIDSDKLDGEDGSYYRDASNLNAGTLSLSRVPSLPASKITSGTLTAARLSGEYSIDITGTAAKSETLGGQNSAYYRNASHLNAGTVPLSRLPTGSGKGLDADLLDGQHGSYYRDVSNLNAGTLSLSRLPSLPTSKITSGTLAVARLSGEYNIDISGTAAKSETLGGQNSAYYRNASHLNAGTVPLARLPTGSGKGLDADLLDGQQGSYYRSASNMNAGTLPLARVPSLPASQITSGTLPLARLPTGSGNGFDADKLDGLQASQLVRNDVSAQEVKDSFAVVGNKFYWGATKDHNLFDNDGVGNVGMQWGVDKSTMTADGGAVEFEGSIDNSSNPRWTIRLNVGAQEKGDTVEWGYELEGKSDGKLTWGEGEVYTSKNNAMTGAVVSFAMATAPAGWLKANGAEVSRSTYSDLFAAIGTTFGEGNGSTTFTIPDMRGEFARGWDDGRGVDTDRVFGSWQEDDFEAHSHTVSANGSSGSAGSGSSPDQTVKAGSGVNTSTTGGDETRPCNVAMLYCIKY